LPPPRPIASPWAGSAASAGSTRCRRSSCWPRSWTSGYGLILDLTRGKILEAVG